MNGYRCCSLPHGNMGVLAPFLSTLSFILSQSGTNWCDFVYRKISGESDIGTELSTGIGLWSYQGVGKNEGYCVWYDGSYDLDAYFETARAFSGLSNIIGGLAMITLWFSTCVPIQKPIWLVMGFFLLLASLFQGFVFFVFKSNVCNQTFDESDRSVTCELYRGSRVSIAAIVFWFVSAFSVLAAPPPDDLVTSGQPEMVRETTTKTEEIQPDGTKVITTKTIYTNV